MQEGNKGIRVRALSGKDVPAVARIEEKVFSLPWSEEAFYSALEDPNAVFLVAELPETEQVVGYALMYAAADEGEITNVATAPSFRKRGAAEAVLKELLWIAREKQLSKVALEVRRSNEAAIRLYQKYGFEIVGIRKAFYQFPTEDAYTMIMRF